jgi:chemotaxis protein MotB
MADEYEEPPDESWMTTYADAITLLMAFFVMLLTFAEYDMPAFEEAAAAIKSEVGKRDETSPISDLQIILQDVATDMQADQVVSVSKDRRGLIIEIKAGAFYEPGKAKLKEIAIPVLENLVQVIAAPRYDYYMIEVEGHSDDDPISTEMFPSNWELSAARAAAVVRYLIKQDVAPHRMKTSGFAETQPKVPNRNEDGSPIPDNQALNRRVNIRITPMSTNQRAFHEEQLLVIANKRSELESNSEGSGGQTIQTIQSN